MEHNKKIYFASDFHLGAPDYETSLIREKKLVAWLESVRHDAAEIFLVGDLFDFWFEYKRAAPRGFTRLLGKISEITDSGIPVHLFTGNHDMWIFDYLPKECGVIIHREPIEREWDGVKMMIGHGDGLGPGDYGYNSSKRFSPAKFANGCSPDCIPISVFGSQVPFHNTVAQRPEQRISIFSVQTKNGSSSIVRKYYNGNTTITLYSDTGI